MISPQPTHSVGSENYEFSMATAASHSWQLWVAVAAAVDVAGAAVAAGPVWSEPRPLGERSWGLRG